MWLVSPPEWLFLWSENRWNCIPRDPSDCSESPLGEPFLEEEYWSCSKSLLSLLLPWHTCVCAHVAPGIGNSSSWLWKAPTWFLSLAVCYMALTSVPPYWGREGGMCLSINTCTGVTLKMLRNYWVFKRCNVWKPEQRKFFLCFRRKRPSWGEVSLTITEVEKVHCDCRRDDVSSW